MKKRNIYTLIAVAFAAFAITGCELAGLDLQEKYDYDDKAGLISNELHKSVWEFLNSRTDAFSLMLEGIDYAGLSGEYDKPNSTYMALTDNAIQIYFVNHRLVNPNWVKGDPSTGDSLLAPAVSLKQYPQEQVREMLLYHIVKGAYSWNNLPPVQTWYDSYASGDLAKVNLYLGKNDRSPAITFNNFPSHYLTNLRARSSNMKANNGSYVHALDAYLEYPTLVDLNDN
ncbi:hypothetical protein KK083_21020 [Fulvivirgaceae bacterium PWU4]|uniref:FAS1 domain-containing protein n=1 Tax=Chryseosolibacter histidini TaxID=2782349 RepID=A0AAP2DQJ4_9BACT|nr:hypothetical protein [Chryseosolibacter histidini]MBT1699392.1 hypothetical protein [Chryseosolibacter histidini]